MRIGEDYPKIEWDFMGFQLLEPNAFIGDTVISIVAVGMFFKARKLYMHSKNSYNFLWMWFFMIFGIGFFAGGIGHLVYNYAGIYGKYGAWYIGIVSTLVLELAMVSQLRKYKTIVNRLLLFKACLAVVSLTTLVALVDLSSAPSKGLVVPVVNSSIGLLFSLAYLGYCYTKTKSKGFSYLYWSILVFLPTIFLQAFKINIHPWFDRNDLSHVLIILTLFLYFKSLQKVQDVIS